jgi:hypothetical protein
VTFEEHLNNFRSTDGTYDLNAAEVARAKEIETTPGAIAALAAKAAKQERRSWESTETANLRKQFSQPALSPELELDLKVPIGKSRAVDYGDMNHDRIRLRKDLRTKVHIDENRAFDAEVTHWMHTEKLLNNGETIAEALRRT